MKKIILAIILLVVLIAVVFVKNTRDQAQVDEAFQQGVAKAQVEVNAYQKRLESLRVSGDQTRFAWSDSLRRHDSLFASYKDSVGQIILAQADKIKELQRKGRTSTKTTAGMSPTKVKTDSSAPPSRHSQILAYYKTRYKELPADLSAYEKKAALTEIRQETVTKFSITLTQLNEIRKTYKLDY